MQTPHMICELIYGQVGYLKENVGSGYNGKWGILEVGYCGGGVLLRVGYYSRWGIVIGGVLWGGVLWRWGTVVVGYCGLGYYGGHLRSK